MAFGFTSRPQGSPIAIDFGADSLKALQVVATNPPQLLAAAAAVVPEHARSDPAARFAFFATALPTLLKSQPFKGRRASLSLPAYATLVQHLQLPAGDGLTVDEQVAQHLRQRLNIDPSQLVIRNISAGQVQRDGGPRDELICFAASRQVVMRHLEIAKAARLDVVGMHCEAVAMLKAFSHLFINSERERALCFIDLGAASTKVVIAHGGRMVFSKAIGAGGDHLTRLRAQAGSLTFADARKLRMSEAHGGRAANDAALAAAHDREVHQALGSATAHDDNDALTSEGDSGNSGGGGLAVLNAQLAAAARKTATQQGGDPDGLSGERGSAPKAPGALNAHLAPLLDNEAVESLIDELQLCVRYHQSLFPQRNIEKLVFLGGESHHVALCQKVARALRIGAQLGDPLARVNRVSHGGEGTGVDLNQPQPGWAVPLGLCLCD